jgi:hypothetical protein
VSAAVWHQAIVLNATAPRGFRRRRPGLRAQARPTGGRPSPPPSRTASGRPHSGLFTSVLLARGRLDELLANGADPADSPELALRAQQLTSERNRRTLADSFERIVAIAEGPEPARNASPRLARRDVMACRATLLDLARALRDYADVNPRGVALAQRLITDGTGPLYSRAGDDALWRAAHDANAALDGYAQALL